MPENMMLRLCSDVVLGVNPLVFNNASVDVVLEGLR